MSICQGGNGFPFFAEQVYQYIVSGKCTGINVDTADIPDYTLKFVLQKVILSLEMVNSHAVQLATMC